MNRLITIITLLMICFAAQAQDKNGCLSKEQFREKQKRYLIDKAGLTDEEAEKFFPLYFELQDQKQQLNEEAWTLLREGKKDNVSEERYEEILNGVYEARISADRLEKSYFGKFKDILSCKKIYLVQQAEMRFHRELLKGMRGKGAPRRNVEK